MKIIVYIFLFIFLISCVQKNDSTITIQSENNNIEEMNENVHNRIEFDDEIFIKTEKIEYNSKIVVGDISIIVPNDYSIAFLNGNNSEFKWLWIQNKIQLVQDGLIWIDKDRDKHKYKLMIIAFNRYSNFAGADTDFSSMNIPLFESYINGKDDVINHFYGQFRRNVINDIKVAECFYLSKYEIISILFERRVIFIYNDIVYLITIYVNDVDKMFIESMPEYFEIKEGYFSNYAPYGWIYEKKDELFSKYKNYNKLPLSIEKLFEETNLIFNSINKVK